MSISSKLSTSCRRRIVLTFDKLISHSSFWAAKVYQQCEGGTLHIDKAFPIRTASIEPVAELGLIEFNQRQTQRNRMQVITVCATSNFEPPPRPPTLIKRVYLAKFLNIIRRVLAGDRLVNLLPAIQEAINELKKLQSIKIYLLDYGCGVMEIPVRLKEKGVIEDFIGVDIYDPPTIRKAEDSRWSRYRKLGSDGVVPIEQPSPVNLALLVDVLHHITDDNKKIDALMELSKSMPFILVKDHMERGFCSRQMLRLADWFGNYSYGVKIPKRYFNQNSWSKLIEDSNLKELIFVSKVKVHTGIFGLLIPSTSHFISILVRR